MYFLSFILSIYVLKIKCKLNKAETLYFVWFIYNSLAIITFIWNAWYHVAQSKGLMWILPEKSRSQSWRSGATPHQRMMVLVTPALWLSLQRNVLRNVNRFLRFMICIIILRNISTLQAVKSGLCDPSCVEFEYLCGVCVPPPPRSCPARCEAAANSGELKKFIDTLFRYCPFNNEHLILYCINRSPLLSGEWSLIWSPSPDPSPKVYFWNVSLQLQS